MFVELKPNCQHHSMALPMLGAVLVLGGHGDPRPKGPNLGYKSHVGFGSE